MNKTTHASVGSKISTNVRVKKPAREVTRFALQALAWLAPEIAERRAFTLFGTPQRGGAPVVPEIPGVAARPFFVSSGPNRLAAWSWGEGPTVLLVHGWNGRAAQMAPLAAPLVDAGYRAVTFDQPAHGSSGGAFATVVDMASAVTAVAAHVGPLHAIVAHSLGATASAIAMSRGLHADRAVLFAPPADLPHFARTFASAIGLSAARTEGFLALLRDRLGDMDALDVRRLARRIATPLLLAHDPHDREVPFAHGKAIAEAWPSARLLTLDYLGHRRPLQEQDVIDEVTRFVTSPLAPLARAS
jgi:pimeloyl-ACP methyl ester carboxylesterase